VRGRGLGEEVELAEDSMGIGREKREGGEVGF